MVAHEPSQPLICTPLIEARKKALEECDDLAASPSHIQIAWRAFAPSWKYVSASAMGHVYLGRDSEQSIHDV
jgi:hypothetical protein